MARSNKKIGFSGNNPDAFYETYPKWRFSSADKDCWSITGERERAVFVDEVLSYLKNLENRKWSEIFIQSKKQNHANEVDKMNPVARKRIEELKIEADALHSLRFSGTGRLYGLIDRDGSFELIWMDLNHGDNEDCVYRSHKKHT